MWADITIVDNTPFIDRALSRLLFHIDTSKFCLHPLPKQITAPLAFW